VVIIVVGSFLTTWSDAERRLFVWWGCMAPHGRNEYWIGGMGKGADLPKSNLISASGYVPVSAEKK